MINFDDISAIVGAKYLVRGSAELAQKNMEWGEASPCLARAWIKPADTEQLAAVLRLCDEAQQPVNIVAGLTNLVRGTISRADELVISVERLNTIEDVDCTEMTMTAGAGVLLQHAHDAAKEKDLLFPWDIGSRGSCMLGGNLASNAGGTKVIKYGMARQNVLGLEVVLANGTVLSSMNRYVKNNSGVDLKQLFIGSEGLYGVITKAVVRLQPPSSSTNVAFIGLSSYEQVLAVFLAAKTRLGTALSGFEVLWNEFYRGSIAHSSRPAPLPVEYPFYLLLEAMGQGGEGDRTAFELLVEQWLEENLVSDAVIAQSDKDIADLWAIRHHVDFIYQLKSTVLSFDISLRIADTARFVDAVRRELESLCSDAQCIAFGHLGDNNLHITIAMDNDTRKLEQVRDMVYQQALPFDGAISGEHGIGLEKKPYLEYSRSDNEIATMKVLKQALDPNNILNRGRVFDID